MDRPLMVEFHLMVAPAAWPSAQAKVVAALRKKSCADFFVTPMYVNSDLEDTELRICALIKHPCRAAEFVAQRLLCIPGVKACRVRLTLQGKIFAGGVKTFALRGSTHLSCHIFIRTVAQYDERVWQKLQQLKQSGGVTPVWAFRDYYEYDRAITLRLIGHQHNSIREYVDTYLSPVKGVASWQLKFTRSSIKIMQDKELLGLARFWCELPAQKG